MSRLARVAAFIGVSLASLASLASTAAAQTWQPVGTGVERAQFTRNGTNVFAAKVDLCAPGIRMRATAPGEGPTQVSKFGAKVGATIAVNGDWWSNDGEPQLPDTSPRGLAVGDGKHFAGTVDRTGYGVIAFGPSIAMHSVMEEDLGGPHFWMQDVVSGQPTLVWEGKVRDNPMAHCGVKRARTATGFDAARTTMYLGVVQEISGSVGMTCNEMAALMQSIGCHSALNQDGGGSSTMWVKGTGVVNAPSDGKERSLVNHWGVIATGKGPPRSCVARDVASPESGVRRHVKSPAVMESWRFKGEDLNLMGQDVLDRYPEGPALTEPPRFLQHSDSSLWLVEQGVKRRVKSFYAIATWRISTDLTTTNADAELGSLPEGPPLREVPHLVVSGPPEVWLIDSVVPQSTAPVEPVGDGGAPPGKGFSGTNGSGGIASSPGEEASSGCSVSRPSRSDLVGAFPGAALLALLRLRSPAQRRSRRT